MNNFKILFFLFLIFSFNTNAKTEIDKAFKTRVAKAETRFVLYSPDISQNQKISNIVVSKENDCGGKNMSPKLIWVNAPSNTKSFAVVFENVDKDNNKIHWIAYNIAKETTVIQGNASGNKKVMPKDMFEGINDFDLSGFSGVCFNDNKKHNFTIKLYALNTNKIRLNKKIKSKAIKEYLEKHKIATAEIKAFYKK